MACFGKTNYSTPANRMTVDVRWIEFGAGAQIKHPIATLPANAPVWPGTAILNTKWITLQIRLAIFVSKLYNDRSTNDGRAQYLRRRFTVQPNF